MIKNIEISDSEPINLDQTFETALDFFKKHYCSSLLTENVIYDKTPDIDLLLKEKQLIKQKYKSIIQNLKFIQIQVDKRTPISRLSQNEIVESLILILFETSAEYDALFDDTILEFKQEILKSFNDNKSYITKSLH